METLTELVKRAQQGETHAYEHIVRRFQDMAVGYAYSLMGNWQEAEDVAQEAFISAYYDLPKLRNSEAFPGWFQRIIYTKVNRQLRVQHPTLVSLDQVAGIPIGDPVNSLEEREKQDEIYSIVQTLPDAQRSVVLLYYINDYTQREIATFLSIPVGTVKTRLHYARKQLKLRMSKLSNLSSQRPSQDNQFTDKVMRLFEATKSDNVDQVKILLAEDQSLAHASGFIQTAVWGSDAHALHVATMHGRKDIIDLLLENGADINVRDETYGFTALVHAIDLADFMPDYAALGMVDFLLERGAEKDVWACWWLGDTDGVKEWLDKDPSLVNQIGPGPSTLLSFCRDVKAVDFLLGYGANPLQTYSRTDKLGVVTPLRDMAFRGNYDLVRHLLNHLDMEVDLFTASIMGDLNTVQTLVGDNSQRLQAFTDNEHILGAQLTALHFAVQGGHIEVINWLLGQGAAVNVKGHHDLTPLHYAICFGPKTLLDPLPTVQDSTQGTAVYHMLPDVHRLLIEKGADLTARESDTQLTPLELAQASFDDETDRSNVINLLRDHI